MHGERKQDGNVVKDGKIHHGSNVWSTAQGQVTGFTDLMLTLGLSETTDHSFMANSVFVGMVMC